MIADEVGADEIDEEEVLGMEGLEEMQEVDAVRDEDEKDDKGLNAEIKAADISSKIIIYETKHQVYGFTTCWTIEWDIMISRMVVWILKQARKIE